MIAYEVARPRPFPSASSKYGSKIFGRCSPVCRFPGLSRRFTYPPFRQGGRSLIPRVTFRLDISITPPSGMAWQALNSRLFITWLIWPSSTSTCQRSGDGTMSHRTFEPVKANPAESRIRSATSIVFFTGVPPLEKVRSCCVRPCPECRLLGFRQVPADHLGRHPD
jgi:hypothetical protein